MSTGIKNCPELREALIAEMVNQEAGYGSIAKDIGIATATLRAFIAGAKEPAFKTISKIINYLKREGQSIQICQSYNEEKETH